MDILIIILIAVSIDVLFGELPAFIHPVVIMGRLTNIFRKWLSKYNNKLSGILLTLSLIIIFVSIFFLLIDASIFNRFLYIAVSAILLSTTFAIKSLISSVTLIKQDLDIDIEKARNSMSFLVSRDTSNLSESELVSAAIETLTENLTDSVTAPIIYSFIFGVLGGVSYRVVNTLDAMVGYKDPENMNVGCFPAKLDDLLNYIPSRITGFLVVIAAFILKLDWRNSYKIMLRDAGKTPSPNSGYPMAAAAGALRIQLVKPGNYKLGDQNNYLNSEKISQAVLLSKITITIFLVLSTLFYSIILIFFLYYN